MAICIVSTFGYLPEVFAPVLAGDLLDKYQGVKGFHIYSIMIAMAIMGAIFCLLWIKNTIKRKKI